MGSSEILDDLFKFLSPSTRPDVKLIAIQTIAQLSGDNDGAEAIQKRSDIFSRIIILVEDQQITVSENALKSIVNLTAYENCAKSILLKNKPIIQTLLKVIVNLSHPYADLACGALANISRHKINIEILLPLIENSENNIEKLVSIFCQPKYNNSGSTLNLLGSFISNITQDTQGRRKILKENILEKLLPFINYSESKQRRKAANSTIHNCCFEKEFHEWLLSDDVSIASYLALPLAGPDTFTTEEADSLPPDLQYLPDTKLREEDPSIRALILESFMQLCATKKARELLRDQNIYLIFRELHHWEKDSRCMSILETVVNILIKTEQEIGEDDLTRVDVPEDLAQKFEESSMLENNFIEDSSTGTTQNKRYIF